VVITPVSNPFAALLAAAVRAPSGDNTQPWRFVVDYAAGTIALQVDETRDRSPMNSGQRMARIALGAALENLLRTANSNGWTVALQSPTPPALAFLRLQRPAGQPDHIDKVVTERVTNRRLYDGRPLPAEVLARLVRETPPLDGVRTHWITERERLTALAALIGRADALMFGEPSMRRAFLSKVRFDAPTTAEVEHGLSLASLEATWSERLALRTLRYLPNWLVRFGGLMKAMAAKARRLIESASGLCLVVAPDSAEATDLAVGQAVQRAWLALTVEGLAVQPMMSWLVLENVQEKGDPGLIASLGRDKLISVSTDIRTQLGNDIQGRPAFLLRFGYAPPPTGRCGRLPFNAAHCKP